MRRKHYFYIHKYTLFTFMILALIGVVAYMSINNKEVCAKNKSATVKTAQKKQDNITAITNKKVKSEVILDVSLINQMAEPSLYNGCEVTSLAMLLNYYGASVTKNELADKLPSVSVTDEDGYYGNPNKAFVGDMTGDESGYFVYHEPIFQLAQANLPKDVTAVDLTGKTFDTIKAQLSAGNPVWVITTTSFTATNDNEEWTTVDGDVSVSMSEHSVVLTGYDEESIYLNDPYGNKNYQTDLTDFIASWEQMGSQAIVLTTA